MLCLDVAEPLHFRHFHLPEGQRAQAGDYVRAPPKNSEKSVP